MKKSIKISLGNVVLHVDDDAYDLLRNYLDRIQARFRDVPGESEILGDIENRMAELFQEKLLPGKEIINLADATEVIGIMGKPEEIGGEAGEESAPGPEVRPPQARRGRRIYRDTSNQRIAGVCSGLAAHFRIDPLLVRILFVVFTLLYGAGVLIYIVLWFGIPEARTAAEKLEMYGEAVNVENIEKQVRQEYPGPRGPEDMTAPRRSGDTVVGRLLKAIGKIIVVFFKVIGFIIAFSFIIAGIAILGTVIGLALGGDSWFFSSDWNLNNIPLSDFLSFFISPTASVIGVIGIILLVAIPLIGLIYGMVKAIFRFKSRDRVGAFSLTGIWFLTLIVLIVLAVNEGIQYSNEGRVTEEHVLTLPQEKTLTIKALPYPENLSEYRSDFDFNNDFWVARENDSVCLLVRPTLRIECSDDSLAGISLRKTARGTSYRDAKANAGDITYSWNLQDTLLVMDPLYRLPHRNRFHAQEVDVTVDVPVGTVIYLDPSLKRMLSGVQNTEDTWSGDLVGSEWIMTREGLTRKLN